MVSTVSSGLYRVVLVDLHHRNMRPRSNFTLSGDGSHVRTRPDHAGRHRLLPTWRARKNWDKQVTAVERVAAGAGFRALRDEILDLARLHEGFQVLDIGAGTGLLTLAMASRVGHVWALDISPAMCNHLRRELAARHIMNADVVTRDATSLPFADGSSMSSSRTIACIISRTLTSAASWPRSDACSGRRAA